jgi:hypothetical protein
MTINEAQTSRSKAITFIAIAFAALVLTHAFQAWVTWKKDSTGTLPPGASAGALVSVQLIGGQIYYGDLINADSRQISLQNVYYVQTVIEPGSNQPNNRLVSRQRTDWHAPVTLAIAADKVLLVELVGTSSRLAQLIEQDKKTAPPTAK